MVKESYTIDTATALDSRIFNNKGKRDCSVMVQNEGQNSVWIYPYRSHWPIFHYLLRPHETHIFENSEFFLQLNYLLETIGNETELLIEIYS